VLGKSHFVARASAIPLTGSTPQEQEKSKNLGKAMKLTPFSPSESGASRGDELFEPVQETVTGSPKK
jgi:hypothetical protein